MSKFTQYEPKKPAFDGFNPDIATQQALGSDRTRAVKESADFQSNNFVTGTSGWRIQPNSAEFNVSTALASLDIPDTTTANSMHVESDGDTYWGANVATGFAGAPASISKAGVISGSNFQITGGSIAGTTTVGIANLNIANRGWTQTSVFSITDADTIAWGAGTFTSADGTAYSISGSNTGNMAAKTYVYLDTAISTTAYQITTTAATAVGAGKVLIATAQNGTGEAIYQVLSGQGGQNIDAGSIVANSITANELSTSITYAGTIVVDTGGAIRSGQTAFDTGTGFFLGTPSGTAKFSIGNSAGNKITWDGSTLTINGVSQLTKTYVAGEALTALDAIIIHAGYSALLASASSQYFTATGSTSFSTVDFTVEGWVKPTSQPGGGLAQALFSKGDSGSFAFTSAYADVAGVKKLVMGGTSGSFSVTQTLSNATWYHVAFVYTNSTTTGEIFVNGTSIGSSNIGGNADSSYKLWLGARNTGSIGEYFDGSIDEVRVWTAARTGTQISNNYLTTVSGSSSGLSAYYRLDNTVNDYTSGAHNLTNNGSATFQLLTAMTTPLAWKSSASAASTSNSFIGFASASAVLDASGTIIISGEVTGLTSLTVGGLYYLANSAGTISTSAGSTTRKAGIATSTTTLLITNIW